VRRTHELAHEGRQLTLQRAALRLKERGHEEWMSRQFHGSYLSGVVMRYRFE
jgi:hypothetical protein